MPEKVSGEGGTAPLTKDWGMKMEMGVFVCFLLVAVCQDLKRRSVELRVFVWFGALALAAGLGRWLMGGEARIVLDRITGASLGMGLLGISLASEGSVGAGDGWFFVISGGLLGFWSNLMLLLYSTFCCGLFCLLWFVWSRGRTGTCARQMTVPFLPFVCLPGIWLLLWRLALV